MAEFRKPELSGTDSRWLGIVAMVLVACFFFGFKDRPTWNGLLPQVVRPQLRLATAAAAGSHGSMNVFERELFVALAITQSHVAGRWPGSWGWSIVLLTAGINLLLLPLRVSSMRSGVKMQRIQPAMQAIKERYKGVALTDPRHAERNAEIAQLQKVSGVNVLGGCLPLIFQMPLLLAFFGMLRKAPALKGAGWLWLHDLSAADPHHILPVLMGVSQLLVQWTTPSPGSDPGQQRMMAVVTTVVFGYVSWHYAAGVALYAVTGSVVSLVTQAVINRSGLGREMQALRGKE